VFFFLVEVVSREVNVSVGVCKLCVCVLVVLLMRPVGAHSHNSSGKVSSRVAGLPTADISA
jgi:hypothetical protein